MLKKSLNGKVVLVVMFAFFMSTLMLPGFTTRLMAAEAAAGAGAAGSGGSGSAGAGAAGAGAAGSGAAAAGAAAGAATAAGIGVGTIAAVAAAAAAVVAGVVSAASSTTSNTSTATPTYNCVLSATYNEYVCSTDSATTITHYLAVAHNAGMNLATAHSHFQGNLTNFTTSHTDITGTHK